jgi:hypothetical protein
MKKNIIVLNPDRLFVDLTSYILSECSPDEIRIYPRIDRIIAAHYPDRELLLEEWAIVRGRYENLHLSGEGIFVPMGLDKFEYFDCESCLLRLELVAEFIRGEVVVCTNDIKVYQDARVSYAIATIVGNFKEQYQLEQVSARTFRFDQDSVPVEELSRLFYIPGAIPYYKDYRIVEGKIVGNMTDDPNMSWALGIKVIIRMIMRSLPGSFQIEFETMYR